MRVTNVFLICKNMLTFQFLGLNSTSKTRVYPFLHQFFTPNFYANFLHKFFAFLHQFFYTHFLLFYTNFFTHIFCFFTTIFYTHFLLFYTNFLHTFFAFLHQFFTHIFLLFYTNVFPKNIFLNFKIWCKKTKFLV